MRTSSKLTGAVLGLACGAFAASAAAAPVTYEIDPAHTYPSFEADHLGGVSLWRGKINSNSGVITMDKEAGTGTVEVVMDMTTIDFGHEGLNQHAQTDDMFDTAQYPTAVYRGNLAGFENGEPTVVEGELTLHGVTQPLDLELRSFMCTMHQMQQREVCGADAYATFQRDDFGVDFGKDFGFLMDVTLRISVEALAAED